ncbi:hypothetical protein SRS16CHR_04899 [Variovorax sp. SRS16]|uniref:EexN family lipoprotein n=1 Tax=Variovorax sp. SRS16 TaxID=282217 RepID=UPI001317AD53|nr:EexN family lipoprotein [Variovorax sp. SRS16]VTU31538.1 hypothetical protein SRS16CHR_04899 [Variovorax sp. SRS16]
MKKLLILAVVLFLSACGKPGPSGSAIESVESLVAHPERLKELRAQCKADHEKVGDAQCSAVAEATRQRFMGSGTPYTRNAASAPTATAATASSPVAN